MSIVIRLYNENVNFVFSLLVQKKKKCLTLFLFVQEKLENLVNFFLKDVCNSKFH